MADILSPSPINNVKDFQAFSGLYYVDEAKATFDSTVNQTQNGEVWLTKVNIINVDLETELTYTGIRYRESQATVAFSKFQSEDDVTSRLVDLKNKGTILNDAERRTQRSEEFLKRL